MKITARWGLHRLLTQVINTRWLDELEQESRNSKIKSYNCYIVQLLRRIVMERMLFFFLPDKRWCRCVREIADEVARWPVDCKITCVKVRPTRNSSGKNRVGLSAAITSRLYVKLLLMPRCIVECATGLALNFLFPFAHAFFLPICRN